MAFGDHELANQWARCTGKNARYKTIGEVLALFCYTNNIDNTFRSFEITGIFLQDQLVRKANDSLF